MLISMSFCPQKGGSQYLRGTRHTRLGRGDETVATDDGGHTGDGNSRCSVLHFGVFEI